MKLRTMKLMPSHKPVLAVQWDRSAVDYVLAQRKGTLVTILAAGTVARDAEDADEGGERTPGQLLAQELQNLGVRRADLVVALGRGSVDVIPLQLPPAGDEELPVLVANQVVRDAGEVAETGIVDFVPLDTPAGEPREVFAFVVDSPTMEQIRRESAALGLKPSAVVYRPLASVTLLRRLVSQSRRTMILLTLHDREADLSIIRNNRLVYTRTARLGEFTDLAEMTNQLAIEVRRSLAAASLTPDAEDQHLYLFGTLRDREKLVEDLAEELALPASLLDPLRAEQIEGPVPDAVGRLSPLLGAVYEHFGQSHPLDFLHPKRPPAPPNYYRRAAAYAAGVAVLLAAAAYHVWDLHAQDAEEIAALRDSLDTTTALLERVQDQQAVVDAVWQWQTDNVNWLDELFDLTRRFPSGRDAIIRRLSISPGRGGQSVIDLTVQVREPDVIPLFEDELRDEFHDVRSKGVSEQSASADYPWQFETRITLRKREVEEYRQPPPATPQEGEVAARSADAPGPGGLR
jgi:hypothetical protein